MTVTHTRSRLLVPPTTAARSLGLSERQVRRLVTQGDLVNHGTPRRILLHIRDIAELHAHREGATRRRLSTKLDGCPLRSA